jgi:hypothetical protein
MTSSDGRRQRKAQEKLKRKAEQEDLVLEFNFSPGGLLYHGPIIETDIGITQAHEEALTRAMLPLPNRVRCRLLVDTGADTCMIKHEFAERAGLKLIMANAPIHGVGVDTSGKIYMGRILFGINSKAAPGIMHQIAIDTQIMSGTLPSDKLDGLIGRDVLSHFDMRYYGREGRLTMKYLRP